MTKPDRESVLKHYGVKGMRWGVINEDETTGDDTGSAALDKEERKLVSKEKAAGPDKAVKDLAEPSERKGWHPTPAQMVTIGVGAVAAGAVLYKLNQNRKVPSFSIDEYKSLLTDDRPSDKVLSFAGKHVSLDKFKELRNDTGNRRWSDSMNGHALTATSFSRPGETYPPGSSFFRLSTAAEKTFAQRTYMTATKDDVNRYAVSMFANEDVHLISFDARETVRTPDLYTRLDALHKVMSKTALKPVKPEDVIKQYETLMIRKFDDKYAGRFFSELGRQGYSAIIDDNNVGYLSESPMVMFNPKAFGPKQAKKLMEKDMTGLIDGLLEIPNRI